MRQQLLPSCASAVHNAATALRSDDLGGYQDVGNANSRCLVHLGTGVDITISGTLKQIDVLKVKKNRASSEIMHIDEALFDFGIDINFSAKPEVCHIGCHIGDSWIVFDQRHDVISTE